MSGERIFFPFLWNHFSVKIENIPYQFKSNLIDWIHDALQSPPLISSSVSTADIIFSLHCWYHLQSPLLISSSASIADIIFSLHCWYHLQSPLLISSSVSIADIIFSLHCWYHLQSPLLISSSVSIADIIFCLHCWYHLLSPLLISSSVSIALISFFLYGRKKQCEWEKYKISLKMDPSSHYYDEFQRIFSYNSIFHSFTHYHRVVTFFMEQKMIFKIAFYRECQIN